MTSVEFKDVTFSTSDDVEEATAPVAQTESQRRETKRLASLSSSAKEWDIDGDGVLDPTESALKSMDKSRKGFLSKEQMYQLMTENLQTQRELFKVKKVVAGLVVFTCILALSNLGTSFAAAFLAKDTKSKGGKLTDVHTHKTIKTDTSSTAYVADGDLGEELSRRRRLACVEIDGFGGSFKQCGVNNFAALTLEMGRDIVNSCDDGGSVTIRKLYNDGMNHRDHPICPVSEPDQKDVSKNGNNPTLTISKDGGGIIKVKQEGKGNKKFYVAEGLSLNGLGIVCNDDADCAANLRCEMGDLHNVCKGINLHTCTMGMNECAANHDCLLTGYHEAARRSLGEAMPLPGEEVVVMPQIEGQCTCLNNDACGGEMVCRDACNIPDLPIQCHDQDKLDQQCLEMYNFPKCAEYVEGTESVCFGEPLGEA